MRVTPLSHAPLYIPSDTEFVCYIPGIWFKTHELKNSFSYFPIFPWNTAAFLPKIEKYAIAGAYLQVTLSRTLNVRFKTLHALVWSVHDVMVHAQDCITSVVHSA